MKIGNSGAEAQQISVQYQILKRSLLDTETSPKSTQEMTPRAAEAAKSMLLKLPGNDGTEKMYCSDWEYFMKSSLNIKQLS